MQIVSSKQDNCSAAPPIRELTIVVVARNEEFGIAKCLASILGLDMEDCQVVCVDHGSTDGTRQAMEAYAKLKPSLFEVHFCEIDPKSNERRNPSAPRNVGLKVARKPFLFFVDGDVEIDERFVREAITLLRRGARFVAGSMCERRYSAGYSECTWEGMRLKYQTMRRIFCTGGIFMAKLEDILAVGLFDEAFPINQDWEFTMRLSARGPCFGIPQRVGVHHTLLTDNTRRARDYIRRGYPLAFGMLVRRHIWRNTRGCLFLLAHGGRGLCVGATLFSLFLASLCLMAANPSSGIMCLGLVLALLAIDLCQAAIRGRSITDRVLITYIHGTMAFVGLFYVPRRH